MSKQRHRRRSQGGTTPETTPQTGSEVAQFSVSEVAQFSMSVDSGGHWLIVVGSTPSHLIVHDPFGEADLVNGTTLGGIARFCRYSRRNFARRWMVEGESTGWAVLAEG